MFMSLVFENVNQVILSGKQSLVYILMESMEVTLCLLYQSGSQNV